MVGLGYDSFPTCVRITHKNNVDKYFKTYPNSQTLTSYHLLYLFLILPSVLTKECLLLLVDSHHS